MAAKLRSDINVTPLVDIVLVLLIVFVVLVPALPRALTTVLPQGGGTGPVTPLRLSLAADGSLDLDGAPLTLADLPAKVRASSGRVLLRVHPTLPFQRAMRVADAVKGTRPGATLAMAVTPGT